MQSIQPWCRASPAVVPSLLRNLCLLGWEACVFCWKTCSRAASVTSSSGATGAAQITVDQSWDQSCDQTSTAGDSDDPGGPGDPGDFGGFDGSGGSGGFGSAHCMAVADLRLGYPTPQDCQAALDCPARQDC